MDWLGSFHFLRPWWLLAALPPLLLAVVSLGRSAGSEQWRGVVAPHLLEHLVSRPSGKPWLSPAVVVALLGIVLACAVAGPAYRLSSTPEGPDDTTLLVVVDLSRSMAGRDIGPSRIGRLRLKLRDLFELRRGARIGLLAVAGSAHVVMPPTDDVDALLPYVDVLDPDLMPGDGERFAKAAALASTLARSERGSTVVLVAADALPPEGADALGRLARGTTAVIGWAVGTEAGLPGEGVPGLDRSGFDRLARTGAEVVDLSLGGADLRRLDHLLDRARTATVDPDDASLWRDDGYALLPLLVLAVLLWFRRGWVIGRPTLTLAALLWLGGCGSEAAGSWWLDLWLTPDQQGRRLFEAGAYAEAAKRFEDPMWRGVAYYAAHDWQHAKAEFGRVDSLNALFNLGNAHAQAREIASAIAVYDEVLERQPTHRGARANRDHFQEILEGLQQTTDFDELKKPDEAAVDPQQAQLRKDQLQGHQDKAAEAAEKKPSAKDGMLSKAESERWMKRVTTTPAEFLRNKFAIQAAAGGSR